jgi:hypothetical protein
VVVGWWLREVLKVVWGVGVWCREWPAAVTFFFVVFFKYDHLLSHRKKSQNFATCRKKSH